MFAIVHPADQTRTPSGSVRFEGRDHGSAVSFFLVDAAPGEGPALHRHPYSETWIVRAGKGRFRVGGETVEAAEGDILVAGPEVPHGFKNTGAERLQVVCIHASDHVIQEWLEDEAA